MWWWQVMGYALYGRPSRRIYVIVGPPGAGKSCVANALRSALGPYASEPADSALSESGRPGLAFHGAVSLRGSDPGGRHG